MHRHVRPVVRQELLEVVVQPDRSLLVFRQRRSRVHGAAHGVENDAVVGRELQVLAFLAKVAPGALCRRQEPLRALARRMVLLARRRHRGEVLPACRAFLRPPQPVRRLRPELRRLSLVACHGSGNFFGVRRTPRVVLSIPVQHGTVVGRAQPGGQLLGRQQLADLLPHAASVAPGHLRAATRNAGASARRPATEKRLLELLGILRCVA